jgi:hypothetical protein|tara:strand:- start:1588 stop:2196 length:609 start_codon:yes stop_codon:yes gene_type:complete
MAEEEKKENVPPILEPPMIPPASLPPVLVNKAPLLKPVSDCAWMQTVLGRLHAQRFRISLNDSFEGHSLGLIAHKSGFELSAVGNAETFFIFAEFETLDRETMRYYSGLAFRCANAFKDESRLNGVFECVWCFPVGIVESIDPAAAYSIRNEDPPNHWGAAEMPVIYERSTNTLAYFEKTPLWGALYWSSFRKQINALLSVG